MNLEKIKLYKKPYQGGGQYEMWLTCLFNPEKITVNKKVKWKSEKSLNSNAGEVQFQGAQGADLKFDLFFDTTDTAQDVREYTDKLLSLTLLEGEGQMNAGFGVNIPIPKFPPYCKFVWGKMSSFEGVIKKIKVDYLMFLPDGTPVRAKAKVQIMQAIDSDKFLPQNPTSRSEARKMRVVLEGERLDLIAYQEYGNAAYWRHLAEVNNISNPLELQPGQVLNIAPPK